MEHGRPAAGVFSPDGHTLAVTNPTAGDGPSGVVFLDAATGEQTGRLELAYSPDSVDSIAYVRGGTALALVEVTRPMDVDVDPGAAALQLWDLASQRPIGDPVNLDAIPIGLVASADGARLVHTFSWPRPPLVWDVSASSWQQRACTLANRHLTRAEWDRYLPGRPYDPGC
jgi:hypothetical protein